MQAPPALPSERDQATVSDLVGQIEALGARLEDDALIRDLRAVHGQGSGIAVKYFLMLAGADQLVKPDRMIMRFLERVLGRRVGVDEAQGPADRGRAAVGPPTSVGAVDYAIWQHERQQRVTVR